MKEKEADNISELERYRRELEELIHERTSELDLLNEQFREEIKEHEHTYSELNQILNSSFPICIINKNHEIIRINDAFSYFFCISKENVIGKKCFEIMNYENCHSLQCTLKQILNGALLVESEKKKVLNNNREIYYLVRATPYRDFEGNVIGIVETYTDITQRIRSEQAVIESEERYRLITETAHDLIRVVNEQFRIEYINEGAHLKTLGYPKEFFFKNIRAKILHPDDIKEAIEFWKKIMKEGEATREGRFKHKDGHWIWFEVKGKRFIDKDGNKKMLFISRDISERKNYETILEEFVISASHQLRTPVSVLVQSLNNLNKYNNQLNEETKEKLIDVISRNVKRLSEIVEDLLNFSEIDDKSLFSPILNKNEKEK